MRDFGAAPIRVAAISPGAAGRCRICLEAVAPSLKAYDNPRWPCSSGAIVPPALVLLALG